MADKMPGHAGQTASSIPGAIYHAPPIHFNGIQLPLLQRLFSIPRT